MQLQSVAARLYDLFSGLPRAYGTYNIRKVNAAKNNKVEGKAVTVQKPVTPALWISHLAGTQGCGIIPIKDDTTCCFGTIDIDQNDINHVLLERKVKECGFPLVVSRSKSGGAHLWLFLMEPLPAIIVRSTLLNWSNQLGYPGVEVFPKQIKLASEQDVGNFINMPYFDIKDTARYAIIDECKADVETFIEYAYACCVTEEELETIRTANVAKNFADGPPCLELLSKDKCGSGERNEGLFNFGVYARLKFADIWDTKLQEYNQKFMDPPLPFKEVGSIIKQLQKKDYFYTCNRPPICNRCNKELCKLRDFGIGTSEQEVDVIVDGLTKIDTIPPTWFVTVDGIRMECETDDFYNQNRFHRLCIERIHKLPALVKSGKWQATIRRLLENVDIIQAPDDAGAEGQFKIHLENFCMGRAPARTKEELLMGKVLFEDGRLHFRSIDLFKYLDQQHFREYKQPKVWSIMQDSFAAEKSEFRIKGRHIRTWVITEFDNVQSEAFTKVPIEQGF